MIITNKHHNLSASKLSAFIECPRAYFYSNVLGWRLSAPNIHLVFGSAIHKALEYLLLHDYSIESYNKAYEIFLADYRKVYSPEWDELNSPKNPLRAKNALLDYTGTWLDDHQRYEILATEQHFSLQVGKYVVKGITDTVLRDLTDDHIYCLEHKSGQRPDDTWFLKWNLDYQPALYTRFLQDRYPGKKCEAIINGLFFPKVKDNGNAQKHYFDRYHILKDDDQLQGMISSAINWFDFHEHQLELLSHVKESDPVMGAFPMRNNQCYSYGRTCPFADFCTAWPNPLKHCDEVPLGFETRHKKKD